MKLRWLLLGVVVLVAIATLAHITLQKNPGMTPQTVTMPNGTLFEFVDVTYGTNHVMGSPGARMFIRLPRFLQWVLGPLSQKLGPVQTRTTHKPALLLWYHCVPAAGNATYPATYLADANGFASGDEATLFTFAGPSLNALEFYAVPRRSRILQLHVFPDGNAISNSDMEQASPLVVSNIPNPEFGTFPQWKPEPLPSTRTAGNLEVTLSRFATGFRFQSSRGYEKGIRSTRFARKRPSDPNHSVFEIAFTEDGTTNAPWSVAQTIFSDATGNAIANSSMGGSGSDFYNISPSLWPDEDAWKLKLIVKRNAQFANNDLFTFTGIPVGTLNQTNKLSISTNLHGATITLEHFILRPSLTNPMIMSSRDLSQLSLTKKDIPAGYYLDLVEAKAGTNKIDVFSYSTSDSNHQYDLKEIPDGAKTIDATFVLHPSRSVEFLVKPVIGDPELTFDPVDN